MTRIIFKYYINWHDKNIEYLTVVIPQCQCDSENNHRFLFEVHVNANSAVSEISIIL